MWGADILVELPWSLGRVALGGASPGNLWSETFGLKGSRVKIIKNLNPSQMIPNTSFLWGLWTYQSWKIRADVFLSMWLFFLLDPPNNYCAYLSLQKLLNLESRTWVSPAATWNDTQQITPSSGCSSWSQFKTRTFWVGCPSFQLGFSKCPWNSSWPQFHGDFIAGSLRLAIYYSLH